MIDLMKSGNRSDRKLYKEWIFDTLKTELLGSKHLIMNIGDERSFKREEKGIIHRTGPEHPIPDIQWSLSGFTDSMGQPSVHHRHKWSFTAEVPHRETPHSWDISSHSHQSLRFASSKFWTGNFEEGMLYQILLHALNVKFLFLTFIKRFFNAS